MEQKRIVISMAGKHPIADAVAEELGVPLVCCTTGEALAYVKGDADDILAFVAPRKLSSRFAAWAYRRISSAPHILYVADGNFCLRQLDASSALLNGNPSVEDLSGWINQELLPAMGFEPLATIYDRY